MKKDLQRTTKCTLVSDLIRLPRPPGLWNALGKQGGRVAHFQGALKSSATKSICSFHALQIPFSVQFKMAAASGDTLAPDHAPERREGADFGVAAVPPPHRGRSSAQRSREAAAVPTISASVPVLPMAGAASACGAEEEVAKLESCPWWKTLTRTEQRLLQVVLTEPLTHGLDPDTLKVVYKEIGSLQVRDAQPRHAEVCMSRVPDRAPTQRAPHLEVVSALLQPEVLSGAMRFYAAVLEGFSPLLALREFLRVCIGRPAEWVIDLLTNGLPFKWARAEQWAQLGEFPDLLITLLREEVQAQALRDVLPFMSCGDDSNLMEFRAATVPVNLAKVKKAFQVLHGTRLSEALEKFVQRVFAWYCVSRVLCLHMSRVVRLPGSARGEFRSQSHTKTPWMCYCTPTC